MINTIIITYKLQRPALGILMESLTNNILDRLYHKQLQFNKYSTNVDKS